MADITERDTINVDSERASSEDALEVVQAVLSMPRDARVVALFNSQKLWCRLVGHDYVFTLHIEGATRRVRMECQRCPDFVIREWEVSNDD